MTAYIVNYESSIVGKIGGSKNSVHYLKCQQCKVVPSTMPYIDCDAAYDFSCRIII